MPVATYQVDILGRGGGRSAIKQSAYGSGGKIIQTKSMLGAASYRSGEPLRDQQLGHTFDYSDREDVKHVEIMLPEHAPDWAADRQSLWNAVEQRENRKNSQLARALIIALPRELTLEQNIALLREHLQEQFVSKGMVADFAIHENDASDGGKNPHAHVLLTLRGFNADGTWQKHKNREWNGWDANKEQTRDGRPLPLTQRFASVDQWRAAWETLQNEHLEAAGIDARVRMKSYQEQGIDQIPTTHMGPHEHAREQQGERTPSGDYNRAVAQENARRAEARAETQAIPASNDNQRQHHAAQDSERQQRRDSYRRAMKDTFAGWQRYWDQQAEWWQQKYATLTSKKTYEKFTAAFMWGAKPEQVQPASQEAEDRQKPRRVWSQEQRDDYRKLQPYLQQHADLTTKERAHAVAKHMQYVQQQREQERRAAMQRIALRQANFRYRSIEQDRPLPTRERTRERGR